MTAADQPGGRANYCPACNAAFDGGPIPAAIREHYSPPFRWSRRIAIYCRDRDRTVAYRCPDCQHEWPTEQRRPEIPEHGGSDD